MKRWIALFFVLAASPAMVDATGDGNELLRNCTALERITVDQKDADSPETLVNAAKCQGFIAGTTETIKILSVVNTDRGGVNKHGFCIPADGANGGQLLLIINKYLRENPEDLHRRAGLLALVAIGKANLCDLPMESPKK